MAGLKTMQVQPDIMVAPGTQPYLDQFKQLSDNLPGQGVDWLQSSRKNNLARFGKNGFPTQKDEDWRYTPLKPVTGKSFNLLSAPDSGVVPADVQSQPALKSISGLDCHRLVFVDGVLNMSMSDISGLDQNVSVRSLSAVLADDPGSIRDLLGSIVGESCHGFAALNGALHQNGLVVMLEQGAVLSKPLEVVYASNQELSLVQPRSLIVMGKGSKAQIIERTVSLSDSNSLLNSITEVMLDEQSELDYYLIQEQSRASYQVSGIWARQKRSSRFSCHTVTFGGGLVRNDLRSEMTGPGAHCDMLGVYSLSGKQHVDNHTTMIHGAAECTSNELYKGVLDERSRGVFHGRIKVEKDAQKTDAQQSNNTLLLSRDAEIDTKPQLEIYADDVKCSHGATIGQLDETSMFYLRSRGIDPEAARSMLTYAFVNDVLGQIKIEPLRDYLEAALGEQLIREQ
jgi:Fe-S cluster assembly protein SufD